MQEVERMHDFFKKIQWYKQCVMGYLILFQFLNGHMPLDGEQVMFGFAHTSWWVNMFICH
jgi:hypothetical protein